MTPMIFTTGSNGETLSPPDNLIQLLPFASKRAMEFEHLQHFKRLVKHQLPHLQFRLLGDGTEPPDFFLSRGNMQFGLELTVFAINERRERATFFSRLEDRLLVAYGRGHLRGLSGMAVEISFGDIGAKPFYVDDSNFEKLVEALDKLGKQDRPSISQSSSTTPVEWPTGTAGPLKWYVSTYSDQPLEGSKLSKHTGFEIQYMYRQSTTLAEVASVINQRISSKDRPGRGIDELLIVAGGPDQMGKIFQAEAMLVRHLLEKQVTLLIKPQHIRRVFIDVWGAERLYLVHEV